MTPGRRKACPTCPWRISVPPGGFPGGCVDAAALRRMSSQEFRFGGSVMACHSMPPKAEHVCIGFAVRVGTASMSYRISVLAGQIDEDTIDFATDDLLPGIEQVIWKHNTSRNMRPYGDAVMETSPETPDQTPSVPRVKKNKPRSYWYVEEYTSSMLLDAEGRMCYAERAGKVYSRHRSEDAADTARQRLLRVTPMAKIRVVYRHAEVSHG